MGRTHLDRPWVRGVQGCKGCTVLCSCTNALPGLHTPISARLHTCNSLLPVPCSQLQLPILATLQGRHAAARPAGLPPPAAAPQPERHLGAAHGGVAPAGRLRQVRCMAWRVPACPACPCVPCPALCLMPCLPGPSGLIAGLPMHFAGHMHLHSLALLLPILAASTKVIAPATSYRLRRRASVCWPSARQPP